MPVCSHDEDLGVFFVFVLKGLDYYFVKKDFGFWMQKEKIV